MFCNKCGAQLSNGSVFCIKCGNNVSDAATAPAQVQVADGREKKMKDLDFVTSGSKLEIVGLTDDGKAWLETVKRRMIRPGCEKYAISAFVKWKHSGKPSRFANTMSKDVSVAAIRTNVQPVKNATGGWGFAIPALISGVLSVLYSVYWIFFREDFIKNTIDPMWISSREEARALLNLVDNLAGFPFGSLALLFAILALLKGGKGARIIAIIALLIGSVGVWLFRVISYLCLYLAA